MRSLLGDYLLQRLQQDIDGTLQLRLFRCLRNAIIDSVLAPKTRLPASRDLAKEIKVSRNTVLSAYEQLQAQGYVEARTGQGTWVAEKLPESFLVKAENTNSQAQEKKDSAELQFVATRFLSHRLFSCITLPMGRVCAWCTRCHRVSAPYF